MALLVTPRIQELVAKPELKNLANSYGKFWCTWQIDRGKQLVVVNTTRKNAFLSGRKTLSNDKIAVYEVLYHRPS